MSPKLFTTALKDVFKNLGWGIRVINVNGEYISHLRFAVDIIICMERLEELGQMLGGLSESSRRVGLGTNMDKMEVINRLPQKDLFSQFDCFYFNFMYVTLDVLTGWTVGLDLQNYLKLPSIMLTSYKKIITLR